MVTLQEFMEEQKNKVELSNAALRRDNAFGAVAEAAAYSGVVYPKFGRIRELGIDQREIEDYNAQIRQLRGMGSSGKLTLTRLAYPLLLESPIIAGFLMTGFARNSNLGGALFIGAMSLGVLTNVFGGLTAILGGAEGYSGWFLCRSYYVKRQMMANHEMVAEVETKFGELGQKSRDFLGEIERRKSGIFLETRVARRISRHLPGVEGALNHNIEASGKYALVVQQQIQNYTKQN